MILWLKGDWYFAYKMSSNIYLITTVIHILFVIVAVGSVTVTDYLHLIGLRKKRLERQLKNIYPKLSDLINLALIMIFITGGYLIYLNPVLWASSLFLTKLALVFVVTINGLILQKIISPNLDLCVMKGRKYCSPKVLYTSAISGSISIVTWYSIVVLALTKRIGYTVNQFLISYLIVLVIAIIFAIILERKARKWNDEI